MCLKRQGGDEQGEPLWECLGRWERNRRDRISRRQLVKIWSRNIFYWWNNPSFSQTFVSHSAHLCHVQLPEVQKLLPLVPSHPALSGHINPVTSGTKRNAIGQRLYFFVTSARGAENIPDGRMEGGGLSTHGPGSQASSQDRSPTLLHRRNRDGPPAVGVCQARGSLCLYIFYC